MTDRVVAYVDGFNLYYGLKADRGRRYLWLDLQSLVESLLKADQELQEVWYFTARVLNDPPAQYRQDLYLDALTSHSHKVRRVEGRFLERARRCQICGARWLGYEEKETDVNIAVALVEDAVRDYYGNAFLISGDSDLGPAVATVKRLRPEKRITVVFPPLRNSVALIAAADAYIRIGADKIRRSQLPPKVVTAGGVALERPAHWS